MTATPPRITSTVPPLASIPPPPVALGPRSIGSIIQGPTIPPTGNFQALSVDVISNMNFELIKNVAVPVEDYDAANKLYVDSSGSSPGGNDTDVQYNSSGSFAGSDNFTWDNSTNLLTVIGTIQGTTLTDGTFSSTGGTITGATWNGVIIDPTYGGTGVNNGSSTLTLGGSLTTSGAFASTFTMTGLTSVTFPTSGTLLSTTSSYVSSVTGTVNQIDVSPTTGNCVVSIDSAYPGQTSITTLGTITTGTWNANVISEIYGGTNQSTYTLGDTLYSSATNTLSKLAGNITSGIQYLAQTGTGVVSAAPAWTTISGGDITGAALTSANDTNVTLTLGGTPATSLLRAASITAGWTGQLATTRGGTGTGTVFTQGSVVFADVSGNYTQDNSKFSWNDTTDILSVSNIDLQTTGEITNCAEIQILNPPVNPTDGTNLAYVNANVQGLGVIQLISGGNATGSATLVGNYSTIQAAISAIPNGTNSTNVRMVYSVLIPPGTYDEDLAVDITNTHIELVALGAVNIGLFNNTFWAASNTRNITITCSTTSIDSIRSTFGMGTYIPYSTASTTHPAYSTAFRLSGSIIWNITSVGFVDVELYMNADIFGNVDSSSATTNNFHYYFNKSRIRGQVLGTRNLFQMIDDCTFSGLVSGNSYSVIRNSSIAAGMTVTSASSAGFEPFGMIATYFAGTFTGPANSLVIDGTTYYYFTTSGATLAGGATVVLLESASGSGITQLTGAVLAGPGSGSVVATIPNNSITNALLAQMAANTVKANITGGTANATDAALTTTATNNSVAQRDGSGNLTANDMIAVLFKPTDGAGTSVTFTGGVAASNGNGGNATLSGAVGSNVGTGGNGGNVNVTAGNANGNNTANQSGGTITLTGGTSIGSSQGGGFTVNLGVGGVGTGTAGATGGTANINAGTGGIGSATSGSGGNVTFNAGTGGAGVGGGGGGTATFHGGNGGTGSSTGGNGGSANVTGGNAASIAGSSGGSVALQAAGGSSTGSGGAGGTATITGGNAGGDNTVNNNGGSVTITAGNSKGSSGGPNVNITAGTGGLGTGTAGANGGAVQITAGSAGAGSATGGTGGSVQITGGNAASAASSAGGQIILAGAVGSSTGAGGAGGNAQLNGGNANGNNTQNNSGGNVTLSAGNSNGSATGGTVTFNTGTGGIGTSTTGANGGAFAINAGAGGLGSATGGTGGTLTISAGAGGNSTAPGSGGDIIFRTANTTSVTEHLRISHDGDTSLTSGNLLINTLGNGLQVKQGTNAKIGQATLAAGTVTVANTSVTTNSRIFLTVSTAGGTQGFLRTAKTAGTSFSITSTSATETSVVDWLIVESIP